MWRDFTRGATLGAASCCGLSFAAGWPTLAIVAALLAIAFAVASLTITVQTTVTVERDEAVDRAATVVRTERQRYVR